MRLLRQLRSASSLSVLAVIATATFITPDAEADKIGKIEKQDRQAYISVVENLSIALSKPQHEWISTPEIPGALTQNSRVAIWLLERSPSREALNGLAYLSLVKLDGAVSESHSCAVLSKGPEIRKRLVEVLEATSKNKGSGCLTEGTDLPIKKSVCSNKSDAIRKIKRLLSAIDAGEKCTQ
jgi:hypothetical protein